MLHPSRSRREKARSLIDEFLWPTIIDACSSFWTGFVWQVIVNLAVYYKLNFTVTFFVVWAVTSPTSLIGCIIHGYLVDTYLIKSGRNSRYGVVYYRHYVETCLCVGCAAACFVGTSVRKEFDGNWLTPLFGEPNEESTPFISMLAAGASTVFGFTVCQSVMSCVVPDDSGPHGHLNDVQTSLLQASRQ